MLPFFALFLCTTFVIFLLRLDHKQAPQVSRALWIPTVFLLYTMSRQLSGWFRQEMTLETGSPLDRLFLITILCLNLILLFKRRFEWSMVFRDNPWLLVLFSFMTISLIWSPIPGISLKRWVRELVSITTAFSILSEHNPRVSLISVLRRNFYILLPFSLLLIKYYPAFGCSYNPWTGEIMWTGVTDQKNHLTKLCVLAVFFIIWTLRQRKRGYDLPVIKHQVFIELFLIFISIWLFIGPHRSLTYSATSAIVFSVGILAFIGLIWAKKMQIFLSSSLISVVSGLIMVYGTITPFIGGLSLLDVSSIVGRDPTLTTRTTHIWSVLVPLAMDKPIIGHGVGGFWTSSILERTTVAAHNGYLEVLLHFGFFGLGLFFLFIFSCAKKASIMMVHDGDWGILFICLLLMTLVHNISESSIYTFTYTLTAIILFFSVTSTHIGPIRKSRT